MMSPRMDTGLVYKNLKEQLRSSASIEGPRDVIQVFDMLMARFMCWQTGSSLMQTVLSCILVEEVLKNLSTLEEVSNVEMFLEESEHIEKWCQVMKAIILGFIKAIGLSMKIMDSNSAIYLEEDYNGNKAGFWYLETIESENVCKVLDAALAFTKKSTTCTEEVAEIRHRLELLKCLFVVFRPKIPSKGSISTAKSCIKGLTPQPADETSSKFMSLFSDSIQARVHNTSPLRTLTSQTADEAYKTLDQVMSDLEGYISINTITRSTDLLSFCLTFSAKRPRPLPIVRAILNCCTSIALLGQPLRTWMVKDIEEISFPNGHSVLKSKNNTVKGIVDPFLEEAELCYKDLLTVFCQNRSRQRQNLAHCILSWDSLQVSAEKLEEQLLKLDFAAIPKDVIELPSGPTDAMPITSWVYLRKLQIMIWVVLLGFELNIYKLWEVSRMYLYARSLVEELNRHLNRLRTYHEQKVQATPSGTALRKSLETSHAYLSALELESMALDQLCQASAFLSISFEKAGLIKPPPTVTTPELMYNLRMKPFSSVGAPGMPSYEQYLQYNEKISSIDMAIKISKNMASSCRSLIDNLGKVTQVNPELELLKRSSLGIVVGCMQLEKALPGLNGSTNDISFSATSKSDGYHWFFPVIGL